MEGNTCIGKIYESKWSLKTSHYFSTDFNLKLQVARDLNDHIKNVVSEIPYTLACSSVYFQVENSLRCPSQINSKIEADSLEIVILLKFSHKNHEKS